MVKLRFNRNKKDGILWNYPSKIYIDGNLVKTLNRGETYEHCIKEGKHNIMIEIEYYIGPGSRFDKVQQNMNFDIQQNMNFNMTINIWAAADLEVSSEKNEKFEVVQRIKGENSKLKDRAKFSVCFVVVLNVVVFVLICLATLI